ncbi:MAG: VOC family protein [Patescibacteria group bacterium]
MSTLSPFIRFNDGRCREAMNFYKDCLGGELFFRPVKGSPMEKDMPADKHDLIMHSTLTKDNWILIGSDMMRDTAVKGDSVGVSLSYENEKDARDAFAKLAEGGEIFMPIEVMFWGDLFGLVTDKYGVEWMLNCPMK